jgi:solute carrier family 8 (sodium/calcium exchanger)
MNPDMCGFGTIADFQFATECCTDSIFDALGRPERELCPNVITGTNEACDFYVTSTCCPGGSGIMLPLPFLYELELDMPIAPRGAAYFVLLAWLFMGVMLISDSFMGAIEEITSATREKFHEVDGQTRRYTVPLWNGTVANLTLMALGSSAPEILLAVIELYGNNYYSGKLGASTIVGSAAFNFFVITAVCVAALPDGEVRYIDQTQVYYVTLSFSLFAYIWILVVIQLVSPDVVTIGEALVTLVFFPILTLIAYLTDIGKMCPQKSKVASGDEEVHGIVPGEGLGDDPAEAKKRLSLVVKDCTKAYGQDAEEKTLQRIIKLKAKQSEVRSRAYYRVNASRALTGGKKVTQVNQDSTRVKEGIKDAIKELKENDGDLNMTTIEFAAPFYSCLESEKFIDVEILRTGPATDALTVSYSTRDGTAEGGKDFKANSGDITFESGEAERKIRVELVDDDEHEPDQDFFIDLSFPDKGPPGHKLGDVRTTVITIIDDDEPGVLSFTEDDFFVGPAEKKAVVWVQRKDGCSANVSCTFACEDRSGKSGKDFEETTGTILFKKGETRKCIEVPLIKGGPGHIKNPMFVVVLSEPSGGAKFDQKTDGGEDTCITQVHIQAGDGEGSKIDNLYSMLHSSTENVKLGGSSWGEQFISAIFVNGSREEQAEASKFDWCFHFLTIPFKLIFAFTPPPSLCGGWLAFFGALGFIGCLTAVVGDTASIFGCILAIPDEISAITLVAVGTSLPDTFASKTAAQAEPFADSSVGNVTGSNSVNVFLGLGIAWVVGALFWDGQGPTDEWYARYKNQVVTGTTSVVPELYPGGGFVVPAGALGFSVLVYSALAAAAAALLQFRRVEFGGELGGPIKFQIISACVFTGFWFIYLGANIYYAYGR